MNKKTSYTNEFKFKVALEAIRNQKTIPDIVKEFNVASCLISKWKKQVLENGSTVFNTAAKPATIDHQEKKLYEQLGRQTMEIDYLKQFAWRYQ
jgi:transposase-like protein